jgi:hypothetical protein
MHFEDSPDEAGSNDGLCEEVLAVVRAIARYDAFRDHQSYVRRITKDDRGSDNAAKWFEFCPSVDEPRETSSN